MDFCRTAAATFPGNATRIAWGPFGSLQWARRRELTRLPGSRRLGRSSRAGFGWESASLSTPNRTRASIRLSENTHTCSPDHGAQSVDTRHLRLRLVGPGRPSYLDEQRADDRVRGGITIVRHRLSRTSCVAPKGRDHLSEVDVRMVTDAGASARERTLVLASAGLATRPH